MLKPFINKVLAGQDLTRTEMSEAVGLVMDGQGSATQIAALLVALRAKGEVISEIAGAAEAMRARMNRVEISRRPLIDTCGTGGSGTGSFNISTAVAFVVASAGVAVAKHGNKAISSRSGSADVLSALGVEIRADLSVMQASIEELGVGFLFAPNFHPAMKHAGVVRRELGIRTIFNVLGPLTNPASAPRQLMGVFDKDLVRPIAQVLGDLGSERAWVVHGSDGVDELTICAESYVGHWNGAEVESMTLHPEELGLSLHPAGSMAGGSPEENAKTMRAVLGGSQKGPIFDAIALNAGAALFVADDTETLKDGVLKASDLMQSGAAVKVIDALVKATNTE